MGDGEYAPRAPRREQVEESEEAVPRGRHVFKPGLGGKCGRCGKAYEKQVHIR